MRRERIRTIFALPFHPPLEPHVPEAKRLKEDAMTKTESRTTDRTEACVSDVSAKQKGVAMFLRPDVEVHTDPTRVIGRCTTCDSDEHPYLRGYEVVVVAVLTNAPPSSE